MQLYHSHLEYICYNTAMKMLFDQIRIIDYNWLYSLYHFGKLHGQVETIYIFWARYGIIVLAMSFIYLIWNKRINALICSMLAMGLAGFTDLAIYLFWKRPTPYIAHANLLVPNTSGLDIDASSFPSSHTYICFAVAVSTILYGHKKLGFTLLLIAILVAISRIGVGLHYPSDVIGGALLGTVAGIVSYLIVHKAEKFWDEPDDNAAKENAT